MIEIEACSQGLFKTFGPFRDNFGVVGDLGFDNRRWWGLRLYLGPSGCRNIGRLLSSLAASQSDAKAWAKVRGRRSPAPDPIAGPRISGSSRGGKHTNKPKQTKKKKKNKRKPPPNSHPPTPPTPTPPPPPPPPTPPPPPPPWKSVLGKNVLCPRQQGVKTTRRRKTQSRVQLIEMVGLKGFEDFLPQGNCPAAWNNQTVRAGAHAGLSSRGAALMDEGVRRAGCA